MRKKIEEIPREILSVTKYNRVRSEKSNALPQFCFRGTRTIGCTCLWIGSMRFEITVTQYDEMAFRDHRAVHEDVHFCSRSHKIRCIRRHRIHDVLCTKSVRIRSYSGPHSVQMRENEDQNNSEYEHFSRSGNHIHRRPKTAISISYIFVKIFKH